MSSHFQANLSTAGPLVASALSNEARRQENQIELIASENIVSHAVLDVLDHVMTNKTLEGYPGHRFHGGGQFVDVVEQAAIDRAKELFGAAYANVQPHSGSQANLAIFFALVKPGDRILSLDLAAGGHLSHGLGANLSGRWFNAHHYGVDRESGLINYDEVEARAMEVQPALLIAGGSAYPREIDFERMAAIAKRVDARFLVDMAHIAGLVAGGVHPSPMPYADIVTCTTTKTLRGPRGGIILARDPAWSKKLQSAVFPGVQGSLHTQIIAAKAVCFGEALRVDFRDYAKQVKENAFVLAETLSERGVKVISGGTDTHIVLLDLSPQGMTGKKAEAMLDNVNITSNKNPIPYDVPNPSAWSGLRLGVAAATTRGFKQDDFQSLAKVIAGLTLAKPENARNDAKQLVAELCSSFPIHGGI